VRERKRKREKCTRCHSQAGGAITFSRVLFWRSRHIYFCCRECR